MNNFSIKQRKQLKRQNNIMGIDLKENKLIFILSLPWCIEFWILKQVIKCKICT